jgi:hypothetical protein
MEMNTDKHALRLSHLSVMQQQRALKALAQKQRAYNKANKANAESAEANTYDWHRKVRLAREARAYNLIRAYYKGLPYSKVEGKIKGSTLHPMKLPAIDNLYTKQDSGAWDFYLAINNWVGQIND